MIDLKVDDVSQNSCVNCTVPQLNKAPVIPPEESQKNSDTPPRPDRLPLDEKGRATWSFHGPESTPPMPDASDGKSSDRSCLLGALDKPPVRGWLTLPHALKNLPKHFSKLS